MSTARDRRHKEALESPLVSRRLSRRYTEAERATQAKQILPYKRPHITRSVSKTSGLVSRSPRPLYDVSPSRLRRSPSSFSPGGRSPRRTTSNSPTESRNTLALSDDNSPDIGRNEESDELFQTPSDDDHKEHAARSILDQLSRSIVKTTQKEASTSPLRTAPDSRSFTDEDVQATPDPVAAWLSVMMKKEKLQQKEGDSTSSHTPQDPSLAHPPMTPTGRQVRIDTATPPPTTTRRLFNEAEGRGTSKGSAWDMTPKAQRFPSVPSTGSPSPKELILGLDMSAAASAKALYDYLRISPSPRMQFDEQDVVSAPSDDNSPASSNRRESRDSGGDEGGIRKLVFLEESTRRTIEWGESISRCHVAYVSELNGKVCVAVQQKAKLAGHLANAEGKWRLRLLMEINSTPSGKHLQSPMTAYDDEDDDTIINNQQKGLVMSVAVDFLEEHEQSCRHEIARMELMGAAVLRLCGTQMEYLQGTASLYKTTESINRSKVVYEQRTAFLKLSEVMKRSLLYLSYKHTLKNDVLQRKHIASTLAISEEQGARRFKMGFRFTELTESLTRSSIHKEYSKATASLIIRNKKHKGLIAEAATTQAQESEQHKREEIIDAERKIFRSMWNIEQRNYKTIVVTVIQVDEGSGRLKEVQSESTARIDLLQIHKFLTSEQQARSQVITEQYALINGIRNVEGIEAILLIEKEQAATRNDIALDALSSRPSIPSPSPSPIRRVRPSRAAPAAPSSSVDSSMPRTRETDGSRMPTRSPPKPPSKISSNRDSNNTSLQSSSSVSPSPIKVHHDSDSDSSEIDGDTAFEERESNNFIAETGSPDDTTLDEEEQQCYADVMKTLTIIRQDTLEWRSSSASKSSWEWGSASNRQTASQPFAGKRPYPLFEKTTSYQQRFNKYSADKKWERVVGANVKTDKSRPIKEGHLESVLEAMEDTQREQIESDEKLQRQAVTLQHLATCRTIRKNTTFLSFMSDDDDPPAVSICISDSEPKKKILPGASKEESEAYLKRYEQWKASKGIVRDDLFQLREIKVKKIIFDDPSEEGTEAIFEPDGLRVPTLHRRTSIGDVRNLHDCEDDDNDDEEGEGSLSLSFDTRLPKKRVVSRRGGIPAASTKRPTAISRPYTVPLRGARKAAAEAAAKAAAKASSKCNFDIALFRTPLPASATLAIDSEEAKARLELLQRERVISGQLVRMSVSLCEKAGRLSGEELVKTITEVTDRLQNKPPPYPSYWKQASERRKERHR